MKTAIKKKSIEKLLIDQLSKQQGFPLTMLQKETIEWSSYHQDRHSVFQAMNSLVNVYEQVTNNQQHVKQMSIPTELTPPIFV